MKALRIDHGVEGRLRLEEVGEPSPAADEALVEVRASSLNRGEVKRLVGSQPGTVPGWDLAGVVVAAAADGSGPADGTRVAALLPGGGAWAERAAVPAGQLVPLPTGVSDAEAACLPMAGMTAAGLLAVAGDTRGKRLLVTGATGGVGRLLVQLAVRGGASVTALAGSEERAGTIADLGAAEIAIAAAEGKFDVILDAVGGESLAGALAAVAAGGTVVTYGNSSGEPTCLDVAVFYGGAPGARLIAFTIFDAIERGLVGVGSLAEMLGLVAEGGLDAGVATESDLAEVAGATQRLLARGTVGKNVIRVAAGR